VWPGASWSSLDYFGNWKALHFHARRFFAGVAVAALRDDDGVTRFSLLNDGRDAITAQWRVRVMDVDGRESARQQETVTLSPMGVTDVARFVDADLLKGDDPARSVAAFELLRDGAVLARRLVHFVPAKEQALAAGQLQAVLRADGDRYRLRLQARGLVRAVWIDFGDVAAEPEDNAFDLLPGETRELVVRSRADLPTLRAALQLRTLGDTLHVPSR